MTVEPTGFFSFLTHLMSRAQYTWSTFVLFFSFVTIFSQNKIMPKE